MYQDSPWLSGFDTLLLTANQGRSDLSKHCIHLCVNGFPCTAIPIPNRYMPGDHNRDHYILDNRDRDRERNKYMPPLLPSADCNLPLLSGDRERFAPSAVAGYSGGR